MTFSYYPGCTLRTKAKDLDKYARASAKALGVELLELDDWQCCGEGRDCNKALLCPCAQCGEGTRAGSVHDVLRMS